MKYQDDIFPTDSFMRECEQFIAECKAKRKEILDAGLDTANDCELPTVDDIISDIIFMGVDDDGEYYNSWGVTDNYDSNKPFSCKVKEFYVDMGDGETITHVIMLDA